MNGLTTNRPTSLSVISLVTTAIVTADAFSRDRTNFGRTWWGDLAELIVYERALTQAERKSVEDYLALKYGLYTPTLAAPQISTERQPHRSRSVHVTLSAEPGAEIRYTIDGSDPDADLDALRRALRVHDTDHGEGARVQDRLQSRAPSPRLASWTP